MSSVITEQATKMVIMKYVLLSACPCSHVGTEQKKHRYKIVFKQAGELCIDSSCLSAT